MRQEKKGRIQAYTPPQSRTGGQERKTEMFRDRPIDRPTRQVLESRVSDEKEEKDQEKISNAG